jgi:hypothetical protein
MRQLVRARCIRHVPPVAVQRLIFVRSDKNVIVAYAANIT